jgi:UDP-MurNAc hydroxylase
MYLQILSHASLLVQSGNKTLVTDPWLIGSCYWRSWWNYPPVAPELIENLRPDAIYLTHIHWDHFHGASLRKFPKNTLIIIPLERSTRMRRDLRGMGFSNIIEVPHAASLSLTDDFTITSYQFSLWGDSALVIEAEGISLLDANDAKFMGLPLSQILRKHKQFDFAFRSHSSANDRVCYYHTDTGTANEEDRTLYAQSFLSFMEKVKPRYAVPFASNHCHLHKDVFHLNMLIETPTQVETFISAAGGCSGSELKVMVSGDSWDSVAGFNIRTNTWFTERQSHLQRYLEANASKLSKTYAIEDKVRVRLDEVKNYFESFVGVVPCFLKRAFKERPIILKANYSSEADYFKIDIYHGEISEATKANVGPEAIVFETTALILKKAMALNMFSHIGISKRVVYRSREEDAKHLKRFNELLAAYEYEVLPLRRLFSFRTVRVYCRRWREIILYVQLLVGMVGGKSIRQCETEQLA